MVVPSSMIEWFSFGVLFFIVFLVASNVVTGIREVISEPTWQERVKGALGCVLVVVFFGCLGWISYKITIGEPNPQHWVWLCGGWWVLFFLSLLGDDPDPEV
tara:strand:- start:1595 stop:1900 length:306 start_codon:yes stop_codon:yes gene_type:complete